MPVTSPVSVARPTRRRLLVAAIAGLLGIALLTSCSKTDTAYSKKIENNFVNACSSKPKDGAAISADTCRCVYQKISSDNGMNFSEFKKVQDTLRDKKVSLDQLGDAGSPVRTNAGRILRWRTECAQAAAKAASSTTTTTVAPATTVAGSSTTVATTGSSTSTSAPASSTTAAH